MLQIFLDIPLLTSCKKRFNRQIMECAIIVFAAAPSLGVDDSLVKYKSSLRQRHPLVKWAAQNWENFDFVLQYAHRIAHIRFMRTGKWHKSFLDMSPICKLRGINEKGNNNPLPPLFPVLVSDGFLLASGMAEDSIIAKTLHADAKEKKAISSDYLKWKIANSKTPSIPLEWDVVFD